MSQDMPAKDQWRDSIRPRIDAARESLRGIRMDDLVRSSGGTRCKDGIELDLFETPLRISLPKFEIRTSEGATCREETQILILDYLTLGVAAPQSGASSGRWSQGNRWIGFQELPDGAFYAKAFRSYTSDMLVSKLDGELDHFRRAIENFGGVSFSLGDAAASFRALPNISLAVVWWAGDDEFPANASVLFDRAASHALPIDGLAALGRLLCRGLLNAAHDEPQDETRTIGDSKPLLGKE